MSKTSLIIVAFIWGITNALISKASKQNRPSKDKNNKIPNTGFLKWITNPLYVISVAVNLLGSLLFFYKLANSKISIAGPLVNSMTLAITAISGVIINKEKISFNLLLGVVLVILGTSLAAI